jgi:hypothetical protein
LDQAVVPQPAEEESGDQDDQEGQEDLGHDIGLGLRLDDFTEHYIYV